ncbi:restriction endonuclease subunit S [Lactiplantibacillus plantarum]|uniref:restriction endonuclease subunit S n=1 Tax=Lactiplantibacillus plantarum TaxID=1590 RepID=UPI0032DE77EA
MKNENLVPKVRFKGFSDPWEQRKFSELFFKSKLKNNSLFSSDKIISVATMTWKKPDASRSSDDYMKTYNIAKMGDIVFEGHTTKEFANGRFVENTLGDGIVSHIFDVYSPVMKLDLFYWKYFIHNERIIGPLLKRSTTNARMMSNLVERDVLKQFLPVPSSIEQSSIGHMLHLIDNLIAANEDKLEQLKTLKKLMMQKIFSQEWRFKGYTDPWEQRKLGDITAITMGQSPSSANYTNNPEDHILVQGNADMKNGYVLPRVWTTQITKKAEAGDLILSVRAPVGDIGKTDYDVVLGRGVASIKGNEFIYQTLKYMNDIGKWTRFSTGSTFESINSADIKDARIGYPKLNEQNLIGNILEKMDSIIAANEDKLNQLKKLKKYLMQNMFV